MRVLLYAPVDLNLIDGSAIWCLSLAHTLSLAPDMQLDLLLNTRITRDINTASLARLPRVRLLDPWRPGDCVPLQMPGDLGPRMGPEQAFERIRRLQIEDSYELLVLRGGPICRMAASDPQIAARSWFYLTQHSADLETCRAISLSNGRIACQTPLLQAYFEDLFAPDPRRYVPLPPMTPKLFLDQPRTARQGRRLCYVGKFEANYRIEETLSGFARLRERFPDAELVVAGDKFHDPDRVGLKERVSAALQDSPGVTWRGALPREAIGEFLAECDVGSCWRSAAYDQSLELSTKALEYSAAGLPPLLNPTRVNRLVFGEDYPLYVDQPDSFVEQVGAAFRDESVYRQAADQSFEASRPFTFAEVARRLAPYLDAYRPGAVASARREEPTRILFAGHDLKFCREIIEHFERRADCIVRIDPWKGHTGHDSVRSLELLRWADAIWCEWCLGAAVWYSARVRPDQRLVIRLHRQEITTKYPEQVAWDHVDHLVFIAPYVQEAMMARLNGSVRDARLVYNTFDCDRFVHEKQSGAERRLGLLGYCPKLKNPKLAVGILQRLLEHDASWRLTLTGNPPQSYAWLWARDEERAYYESLEKSIASRKLEDVIVREDWTDDPAAWYADIAFILSTSDLEGSHQAIAEGMAAGCVPVVRRWRGAEEMYPNSLLFDTADEAARLILHCQDAESRERFAFDARREARERFDRTVVLPQLEELLLATRLTREQPGVATD